jgi:hypothetical protein
LRSWKFVTPSDRSPEYWGWDYRGETDDLFLQIKNERLKGYENMIPQVRRDQIVVNLNGIPIWNFEGQ